MHKGSLNYVQLQKEFGWDLPFGDIAKIWRAGCIIRARFLQKLRMPMKRMLTWQT